MSFADDPWFSGFAAGEGSFGLKPHARGAQPRFTLELRDDDEMILRGLCAEFGGAVSVSPATGERCGMARWQVGNKESLVKLVAYFERFPLRARKQEDFVVWARAVAVYVADGYRSPGLVDLREELIAARRYSRV
jgi:hypothetical protein